MIKIEEQAALINEQTYWNVLHYPNRISIERRISRS